MQWEKGLSMAAGKYAWIAEADDVAEPTFLEKAVRAVNADNKVAVVMSLSYIINENSAIVDHVGLDTFVENNSIDIFDGYTFLFNKMGVVNSVYNASMALFSIDAWRNVVNKRYLKMRYCGDWMFWCELIRENHIAVIREKLNRFRKHGSSVSDAGNVNYKSKAEIYAVSSYVVKELLQANFDMRIMFQYRWLRDYRKYVKINCESRLLDSYCFCWVYKHVLRWTRHFSKTYRDSMRWRNMVPVYTLVLSEN
jgi:hypothetical protein